MINIDVLMHDIRRDSSNRVTKDFLENRHLFSTDISCIESVIDHEKNRLNTIVFGSPKILNIVGVSVWSIRSVKKLIYSFDAVNNKIKIIAFDFNMDLVMYETMKLISRESGIYFYSDNMKDIEERIKVWLPNLSEDEIASIMLLLYFNS